MQCISELRDKAQYFLKTGYVTVLDNAACVVKSDTSIQYALKEELKAAVKPLEEVPDDQKDWHPGSGNQVLDLVHPSLYPLMYGQTRILLGAKVDLKKCAEFSNAGVIIPKQYLTTSGDASLRETSKEHHSVYGPPG